MAKSPAKKRSPGSRWSWRRRIVVGILALGAVGALGILGLWTQVCADDRCPSTAGLTGFDPDQASKVYTADGRLLTDLGATRRTVISLDSMAPALPAAFLAVEDKRFYEHNGVDWLGVASAVKDRLTGRGGRGASTITMQLAGNLWPEEIDRTQRGGLSGVTRKIKEARVAQEIERRYSKDKILELYLNQINLGNGANGVESAAERYFGKRASEVNVAEAALLAALPQAPSRYNPRRNPRAALARRNTVLALMGQAGQLTPEEVATWQGYPIALSSRSDYTGTADYFVEFVRQQLDAIFGPDLYRDGLRITTTLDLDAQRAAERAMTAQLDAIESGRLGAWRHPTYREVIEQRGESENTRSDSPYLQGAAVILEAKTGNILAMVGGRDFEDSKFNRAVQALRQPGSTFKPIVYAAALTQGIPFESVETDEPVSVPMPDGQPNWEPANYDGKFDGGAMTLRQALWLSKNSIAVKVGLKAGVPAIVETARKFGLRTRIPSVPSIILGSAEVYPIEMVAAYTTFANLGTRVEPNAILRVEDRSGRILFESTPKKHEVLDPATTWQLTDALRGVVTSGTARSAVWAQGFQIPSGGKTGTTNDYYDVWYIGFTNDLVGGVWIGFDRNTRIMSNAQGGRLAAPAWTLMMQDIYQRRATPTGWAEPEQQLTTVEIDRTTGFRATPFCPDDVREMRTFPVGGEPKDYCPIHSPFRPGAND